MNKSPFTIVIIIVILSYLDDLTDIFDDDPVCDEQTHQYISVSFLFLIFIKVSI